MCTASVFKYQFIGRWGSGQTLTAETRPAEIFDFIRITMVGMLIKDFGWRNNRFGLKQCERNMYHHKKQFLLLCFSSSDCFLGFKLIRQFDILCGEKVKRKMISSSQISEMLWQISSRFVLIQIWVVCVFSCRLERHETERKLCHYIKIEIRKHISNGIYVKVVFLTY